MMSRILLGCTLAAALAMSMAAAAADIDAQRENYVAALTALRAGDEARYRELLRRLDGYVLRGYAEFEFLKDRVERTDAAVVRDFILANAHTPLPNLLRQRWLHSIADRGDWATFLREYAEVAGDTALMCLHLDRRLKGGDRGASIVQQIDALWESAQRQPTECNPVFAEWRRAGHATGEKVWERIGLAMDARALSLVRDLSDYLPPAERVWVDRWLAMHRDPASALAAIDYPVETPVARTVVRYGVVRLAYRDPEEAMRRWQALKRAHEFFGEDENYVLRYIGILAAQKRSPSALKWLSAVSAESDDLSLKLWRVYAALWAGEWDTARRFIAALPDAERASTRWRYWSARILERGGDATAARPIYAALARERDYYGFLAADRIGADYAMQHVSVDAAPAEIAKLEARRDFQSARELYTLSEIADARRQWQWATRDLNNRELQVAAVVARQWGWYDRAIQTVVKSGHPDDLELRFPVIYRDVIEANAEKYDIDPGWIYGVVRQESAFVVDARSDAGALGLMQLLPSTGRAGIRQLRLRTRVEDALLSVETNVRIGVNYLKQVLDRYGGHQVLATAAYNAGPNRVNGWIPDETIDADVWIETIPYSETRGYVKNVLAFAAVYEYRLGKQPTRLNRRMPAVAPRAASGAS
ncbi:MAG TPA: transglycosylase SLT domain-containing protein [Burkholderiales bacterium]